MKNIEVFFAVLQGLCSGAYTTLQKLGSTKINPAIVFDYSNNRN